MKYIITSLLALLLGTTFVLSFAPHVGAVDIIGKSCKGNTSQSGLCQADTQNIETDGTIKTGVDILMFLVGVISVISIIIGGIIYVTSNGDSSKITQAKNIILYSIVGLVAALLSWGIVRFVLERF